jgi:hypothetical protein
MVPVLRIWSENSKTATACGSISYHFSHNRGGKKNNIPRSAFAGGAYFSRDNKGCQPAIQTVSPDHSVFDVLRPEFQTDRIAAQVCATIVGMDTNFCRQPHATVE